MKRKGLTVVLVVPPLEIASRKGKEAQIFENLGMVVDRLSVMTYDYANRVQGFPNAPIDWVRKVMTGFSKVRSEQLSSLSELCFRLYLIHLTTFHPPSGGQPSRQALTGSANVRMERQ